MYVLCKILQVLSEDMAGSEVQRNTRRCLLSFFSSFDSETLPPPSTNPAVMSNIENPAYYKEINPAFRKKSEIVISRIMLNYCAKRGFTEGSLVSGSRKPTGLCYLFFSKGLTSGLTHHYLLRKLGQHPLANIQNL